MARSKREHGGRAASPRPFGAAVVAAIGALRARDRATRRAVALLATGLALSAVADLVFQILAWRDAATDISVADIPWLSCYLAVGGVLLLLRPGHRERRLDLEGMIDGLVVLVAGSLLAWELAIAETVADPTLPACWSCARTSSARTPTRCRCCPRPWCW